MERQAYVSPYLFATQHTIMKFGVVIDSRKIYAFVPVILCTA